MKKVYPKVDLFHVMKMAAEDSKSFGISMGMMMAQKVLIRAAERALILEDPTLMACLYQLCIIKTDDAEKVKEFDKYVQEMYAEVSDEKL